MSQQTHYQPAPQGPTGAPAPQAARNGLGVAALILGIIGALSGIPMILFWLAGPLGVLALIFGLVGLSRAKKGQATNKGVAVTGTILGALALVLAVVGVIVTVLAVNKAVDEVHQQVEQSSGQPKNGSGESAKDLGPGETAKYNNGVQVTVSKAAPYTVDPNTVVSGHTQGNKAYKLTVTVKNTGSKAFDKPLVQTKARANGKEAEEVDDDKHGILHHDFGNAISPGESASVEMVFDAPPTAKQLDVEVTPDFLLDAVSWKLAL
ncbi:DUF4352 domain-containing protein [Streptomyces sp. RPA4-5]|uniref:DUF4190 domain-containing protein n=1 Tax=Streptomyces TaxID=1883 RepID=UPI00143E648B|nr:MULTISPECIES: DUF4190 domain-containing protein [Streptomyces]MCX4640654.1 DUF4352 domain-containing protein [Streptomyces platensis]QIY55885.1 DUF4352 domain-containing protein [Streptomyces sp. RPA4-5]